MQSFTKINHLEPAFRVHSSSGEIPRLARLRMLPFSRMFRLAFFAGSQVLARLNRCPWFGLWYLAASSIAWLVQRLARCDSLTATSRSHDPHWPGASATFKT
jgi:hypothetical protein